MERAINCAITLIIMIKLANSFFTISLALVLLAVGVGLVVGQGNSGKFVFAGDVDFEVDFESAPLFDEHSILPGQEFLGRWFKVKNTSSSDTFDLYFVVRKTGGSSTSPVDFAEVLNVKIEKDGGGAIYNGDFKTLFDKSSGKSSNSDLDEDDGISLDTKLNPDEEQKFHISVIFDASAGNDYQGKEVVWDALLGFVGGVVEGDDDVLSATTGGDILGEAVSIFLGALPATGGDMLTLILVGIALFGSGLLLRRRRFHYKPT